MENFGPRLRAARNATGIGLDVLAGRMNVSKSHLSRLETGQRPVTPATVLAYERALGINLSEALEQRAEGRERGFDVQRRDFLGTAVALAVSGSAALREPLESLVGSHTPYTPTRVGLSDVEDIERATAQIASQDLQRGGHLAADQGASLLRWALELRRRPVDSIVERRLDQAMAYLADRTAWANFDSGRHDQARSQFQLGLALAGDAGDGNLRAQIVADMANQSIYLRQPGTALKLIQAAESAPDLVPELRSALYGVRAEAYAAMGDPRAAMSELARAEDTYATARPGGAPSWSATFRTQAGMHAAVGYAGYLMARASGGTGTAAAIEHLDQAVRALGDGRGRAAMFASLRAATLHLSQAAGDPGTGAQIVRLVLPQLDGIRSTRMITEVRALRLALARHERRSDMADLAHAVDQQLTQFAW